MRTGTIPNFRFIKSDRFTSYTKSEKNLRPPSKSLQILLQKDTSPPLYKGRTSHHYSIHSYQPSRLASITTYYRKLMTMIFLSKTTNTDKIANYHNTSFSFNLRKLHYCFYSIFCHSNTFQISLYRKRRDRIC